MNLTLQIKLASLAIHVQEMDKVVSPAFTFDLTAAKALADDPEVVEWMATLDPVFPPEKRG